MQRHIFEVHNLLKNNYKHTFYILCSKFLNLNILFFFFENLLFVKLGIQFCQIYQLFYSDNYCNKNGKNEVAKDWKKIPF